MKFFKLGTYMWLLLLQLNINLIKDVDAAKILAIFPYPGKSHHIMLERIAKSLASKGHEIDVYSHFPLNEIIKGYKDYSLAGSVPILTGNTTLDTVKSWKQHGTMVQVMVNLTGTFTCEGVFKSQILKDLRDSGKKYDLFIGEIFGSDCMLGFAHHFKVPSVLLVTGPPYPWAHDFFAIPDNPSYIPNYHSDFSPKMTFYERLKNTLMLVTSKTYYKYYSLEPSTIMAREFFGSDMPHLSTLLKSASIQLQNTHFSINQARPFPPNVIEVGGIHIEESKPLNEHFSNLIKLEPHQKGVIYFTLGSLIKTETLPDYIIQGMSNALARLPYKVLWKARIENFSSNVTFADNIHFEWWMPQFDILCHPNVKLYISHGGNAGIEEAVYCGVPVLGIPLFGDQSLNIAQLLYLGAALKVELDEINENNVYEAAYRLLSEPQFQESAKKVQHNFKDRPMTPLQTALYWIEYVIRHQGAPVLKSAATKLTWYQYHLLDVIFVLVSVPCFVLYLVYLLVKKCYCKSSVSKGGKCSNSQTTNKKKR